MYCMLFLAVSMCLRDKGQGSLRAAHALTWCVVCACASPVGHPALARIS